MKINIEQSTAVLQTIDIELPAYFQSTDKGYGNLVRTFIHRIDKNEILKIEFLGGY